MGESRYALREMVKLDETDAQAAVPSTLSALAQIMWDEGVPQTGAKTPKAEAVRLLQVAAEVEHALLAQYLYSAYSLNPDVQQAADAQLKIIEVAKQEMAHLITVQNILLALGAKVDLNRENFPKDPKDYPFPVVLEPLSSDALAKYVTTESPTIDKVAPADRNDVIAIAKQADRTVTGTARKVNHVGVIYAKLYWLFQQADAAEGPWLLDADVIECFVRSFGAGFHLEDGDFADPTTVGNFAATPTEWGVSDAAMHVDSGTPRSKALAAIAWITAQGEGPNQSDTVESHFQTFLSLYRTFKAGLPNNAVLDIPVNPSTDSSSTGASSANLITDPVSLRWAQVLNLRYQILLLDIVVGLGIDRSKEAPLRTKITNSWAVRNEMRGFLFVYDRLVGVTMFCERKGDFPWTDCTLVEAIDQGWFYSVSIPSNNAVLVYMTDADLYAKGLRRSKDFFHEQVGKTVWTRKRMVAKASSRTLYSAVSSVREKVAGKNWMTIGDASRSFDPLSSQGILNAVRSGIDAANTILREPKDSSVSTEDYENRNRRVFAEYLGTHRKVYGMEKRWPDSEFWARRQCGFLSPLAA
jgi:hypothetical protein